MRIIKAVSALVLLAGAAGCYPRTQTQYNPAVVETPQPVQFFQGTLIDRRPATFGYGTTAGIGAAVIPSYPNFAGLAVGGYGSTAGIGAALPGVTVLAGGVVPELPATDLPCAWITGRSLTPQARPLP